MPNIFDSLKVKLRTFLISTASLSDVHEISETKSFQSWLVSNFQSLDFAGPIEVAVLNQRFDNLQGEAQRLDAAKELVRFFTQFPEKLRLLCNSMYYMGKIPNSVAGRLIFIAGNFAVGRGSRCLEVAKSLANDWPNSYTQLLLTRVIGESNGVLDELGALRCALALYPEDKVIKLSLIEVLVAVDQSDEANNLVAEMIDYVQEQLADEIAMVKQSQFKLEQAILDDAFAPEADNDIYTDEMCRSAWTSYYESFVTRREHQHGDKLLLNRFVEWVKSVKDEVDVVLDFGVLCAQNLYEAALMAPHIHFVGTDRQKFVADMNYAAYQLPNLSFEHGDIFQVMEKVSLRPGRKAFTHIRTTCTLYPKFVQKVYEACARLKFGHIYFIENAGFVRSRLKFESFHDMKEIALVTKHRLNMHNYKKQLTDAGYKIEAFSRLRAPGLWRGEHPANFLGSQYEIHARAV